MPFDSRCTSRRSLLKGALRASVLSAAMTVLPVGISTSAAFTQSETEAEPEENRTSTLILLGTQGGPGVTLTRGETASLLVVEDQKYLVDCGYGTLRALVQAGADMLAVISSVYNVDDPARVVLTYNALFH